MDFNVEASFLRPMAIVTQFWKPLAIFFQMPPSYGPLKQINITFFVFSTPQSQSFRAHNLVASERKWQEVSKTV